MTSLLLCAAVLAAPPASGVLPEYSAVAMMPLSTLGSTDSSSEAIERVLQGELRKLLAERLALPADLAARDPRLAAAVRRCDGLLDCLVEAFGAAGWPALVVGNLAGLGDSRVINLKLVDLREGKERRRASEQASGEERALIGQMRKAAVSLLAPELFTGALEIVATQPGVQIVIDGKLAATTPLESPRLEVLVGRHAVEATGEGLVPFSTMVEVGYGEVVPLTISLPQNELFVGGDTPYRARWWPWVLGAVGVGAAASGGYFYYDHRVTSDRIVRLAQAGELDAGRVELRERWQRDLTTSRWLGGAGGALVLGVSGLFLSDLL